MFNSLVNVNPTEGTTVILCRKTEKPVLTIYTSMSLNSGLEIQHEFSEEECEQLSESCTDNLISATDSHYVYFIED